MVPEMCELLYTPIVIVFRPDLLLAFIAGILVGIGVLYGTMALRLAFGDSRRFW